MTIAFEREDKEGGCYLHSWALTTADGTGAAISVPGAPDMTVQFQGTWGGATAVLEGSLDGTNYFGLTDPQGNAISKTDNGGEMVLENVLFLRPRLSTAGTDAAVNVYLLSRATR